MRRNGFSLIEILMVFVIFGIIVTFGYPRFRDVRESTALRSALDNLTASFATARAAAIRRGGAARVEIVDGNSIRVDARTRAGELETILEPRDLYREFGVEVHVAGAPVVEYNARGFAMGITGEQKYVLTRGQRSDSLCLTGLGLVMKGGCGL